MFSIFSKKNKNKYTNGRMMKLVVKMDDMRNPKSRRETMKAVSALLGINSLTIDKEKKTLTVVGNVDPVEVVHKLRKLMPTEMEYVGPSKAEEKEKKDEGKDAKIMYYPYYYDNGYYPWFWPSN